MLAAVKGGTKEAAKPSKDEEEEIESKFSQHGHARREGKASEVCPAECNSFSHRS